MIDKYRVTMPGFFIWVTSLVQEKKYDNIQEHPIMLSNTFKKDLTKNHFVLGPRLTKIH